MLSTHCRCFQLQGQIDVVCLIESVVDVIELPCVLSSCDESVFFTLPQSTKPFPAKCHEMSASYSPHAGVIWYLVVQSRKDCDVGRKA